MNINWKMADRFAEFIYDRHLIYNKKKAGDPWPWTQDPILQKYKFCNVYRELDTCTIYLYQKLQKYKANIEEILFLIILFRRFNVVGIFTYLFQEQEFNDGVLDFNKMRRNLDKLKRLKIKFFNEAYTLCQVPYDKKASKEKHVQILLSMKDIWNHKLLSHIPQEAPKIFEWLQIKGHRIGPFLAYQVMQDLNYQRIFPIPGFRSFTYVGPGAEPALNLINPPRLGVSKETRCAEVHEIQAELFKVLKDDKGKDWSKIADPRQTLLSIHNIQASLCEFRKYLNLSKGKGRKRLYRSKNARLPIAA